MSTSKKRFCKDSSYSVTIIEKLKVTNRTDQNGMDKSSQPLRKAKKRYWMMELRTLYPYSKKTKMKTENIHDNVEKKLPSLLKKQNRINCWSLRKGFCKRPPHEFNSKLNTTFDTNIRDVPNFIRTFLSSMRKKFEKYQWSVK